MKIENAMMQPRTAERHMSEARCNGWNAIGAFRFDETTTGAQRPESKEASKMIENRVPGTKIVAFTRYKMGDGLEKKVSDLAAEVAEQIGGKA